MYNAGGLACRCSPQRKAEKGATVVALQGAPKVQERPKGIGELAEQVCVLEADLQARLGRGDAGQVAAVRVKHDHVVARHKHGYVCQIVDRVESQSKSLHRHTANSLFSAQQTMMPARHTPYEYEGSMFSVGYCKHCNNVTQQPRA